MRTNIVHSSILFSSKAWSILMFFPREEISVNEKYSLMELKTLVSERRENFNSSELEIHVNYVGLENIESKTGRLIGFEPKIGKEIKSTCKCFKKGDILVGRLRPNLNKVYWNDSIEEGICSTEIIVLRPDNGKVNAEYLAEIIRTDAINESIVNLIKGAALPRINVTDLLELKIPVPAKDIQDGLAKKIRSKRVELEEHIRRIHEIPAELDSLITTAYN